MFVLIVSLSLIGQFCKSEDLIGRNISTNIPLRKLNIPDIPIAIISLVLTTVGKPLKCNTINPTCICMAVLLRFCIGKLDRI